MIFVLATAGAFGQPRSPAPYVDANVPPATRWTYHLPFSETAEGVRSAVFAPDRPSVYVHMTMPVFDTWRALVWYWPELLGAALGVATIAALLIAWRVARRRQVAGAPHCRKCNYDLSPQVERDERGKFRPPADDGARCPECGVLIGRARPVRGRRTWVRLSPLAAAWAVLAGGYAELFAAGVPREGRGSFWFDWSSASLAGSIKAHQLGGLAKFVAPGDRVVEVDLRTGKVSRVVTTLRSRTWSEISVTPDGSGLILAGDRGGTLQLISTRTGRRLLQVRLPEENLPLGDRIRTVIGYSLDGKVAYVQWTAQQGKTNGVSEWNLTKNEIVTVARTSVPHFGAARGFVLRPGPQGRIVSFPSFPDAVDEKGFVLETDEEGEGTTPVKEFAVAPKPEQYSDPRVTRDGAALYLVSEEGQSILRVGLDEPHTVETLSAGGGTCRFGRYLEVSHDNRYLVAELMLRNILVRDLTQRCWVAALAMPNGTYRPKPEISVDNRWVAAVMLAGDGQKTRFRGELVLWDLGQILSSTSSGGEASAPSSDPSDR